MKIRGVQLIAGLFLAVALAAPALASTKPSSITAVPGSLNYVEGKASIGSQALAPKSVGSAELQPGQTLTTQDGKAEVLLTPGVFLRLGAHSAVKMVSPSLTNTEVALEQGHAIVEVDEVHKQNDIHIDAGGASAQLLKTGLYDVNLRNSRFRVLDGEASVREGDQQAKVKGGHQLKLTANPPAKLKSKKFNKKQEQQSDLYKWSSLRSAYLAEANVNAAAQYAGYGYGPWGPGWWGSDWYWDPYFDSFTFIPADGIFYSPFGWGFYSPMFVYQAPFYFGGGYPYGAYGYPYGAYGGTAVVHHFNPNPNKWGTGAHYPTSPHYNAGIYRGEGSSGAFHSGFGRGPVGSAGGGFGAMGVGGFHSGAMRAGGGGFHGGFHGVHR